MFVRQRLTLGLSMILGLIGWMAVPLPAQSGAQPAQAGSSIVDSIRFREIGPTRQGGRYVEFAVVESNPRVFYAATATGGRGKPSTTASASRQASTKSPTSHSEPSRWRRAGPTSAYPATAGR